MSVYDYLKDYALKNVWCSPDQDTQFIFKLAKISDMGGVKGKTKVLWKQEYLPDTSSVWNVYQIGQAHPMILGLFPESHTWVKMSDACIQQKMIVDIYTDEGINLPRFQTYYKFNEDRDLIVAVKKNPKIPFDFNHDDVYIRVYTNEYFNTLASNQTTDIVHVDGRVPADTAAVLAMQTTCASYVSRPGAVNIFVNGFKQDVLNLLTVKPLDIVEFVYDSSVYKVVDFHVQELNDFASELDLKRKYLLHYAGADNGVIDYQDDIDVFVLLPTGGGRTKGLYYHKNNEDALRNITHRDYSVVIPYISNYARVFQKNQTALPVINTQDLYVRLQIRKSGYNRPLVFENSRIHEMYKMRDVDVLKSMLGFESTVTHWRAEKLENAGYTQIMRSECSQVTNELVQKGLGYNAISKVLADTPSNTYDFSSKKAVDVPYGLQTGATAYEYDVNGNLLGWYVHLVGARYTCFNNSAAKVEFITGIGTDHLDEYYDTANAPANPKNSHRVYSCKVMSGVPDNKFVDVTDDDSKYSITNGRFIWTDSNPSNYPMLRSNAKFLAQDLSLRVNNGELKFSLTMLQKRGATWSNWIMHVPMGEIDVFLNKKSLIRNLDYVVQFPEVVIINKEHLINPATDLQQIHIRQTGFCKKDLSFDEYGDYGFIVHGVLSNNKRYDIRDDKVLRITVKGALKSRADLVFSEFHTGVSVINALNGQPYQVKDIVVPFKGLTSGPTGDTYELREKSIEIDKMVSDYLTLKIPQPPRPAVTAVANRYVVFSPFLNKIIYDLDSGALTVQDRVHQAREVMEICKPYERLLKFDPTSQEFTVDDRFVIIHPHNLPFVVNFTIRNYRFLQQVMTVYTKNKVQLAPHVVLV